MLAAEDQPSLTTAFDLENITETGDVVLPLSMSDMLTTFSYGDTVSVSFLGQTLDLRLHMSTSRVEEGTTALYATQDQGMTLTIKAGDFATTYGIAAKTVEPDETVSWQYAEGVDGPVQVEITLKEKYVRPPFPDINHGLKYKNNREDYPQLTDEEFANFRVVSTTGMGENVLYRTSSPVDSRRTRSPYADAALREARVTVIMNLSDNEENLVAYEGYDQTYYSTVTHVAHRLGLSFEGDSFKSGLADGLRLFAQNPGTYAVHCIEGKDRTGFTIALLECLMGASTDEVIDDYMVTFYNYFGVTPEDEVYNEIVQDNITAQLKRAFEIDSLDDADLVQEAEEYILSTGITPDELEQLKKNLGPKVYQVTFEANGHGTAPETQSVKEGACATRPDDPSEEGFVFDGWYLDEACTEAYDFATLVTQDVTLFARWTETPVDGEDDSEDEPSPTDRDDSEDGPSPTDGDDSEDGPSPSGGTDTRNDERQVPTGTSKTPVQTNTIPKTSDSFDSGFASIFALFGLVLSFSGLAIRRASERP